MIIKDIECKYKKEKFASTSEEMIISLKLIVTLSNGNELIEVELYQNLNQIEKDAIEAANHKLQKVN